MAVIAKLLGLFCKQRELLCLEYDFLLDRAWYDDASVLLLHACSCHDAMWPFGHFDVLTLWGLDLLCSHLLPLSIVVAGKHR